MTKAEINEIYTQADTLMKSAETIEEYHEVIQLCKAVVPYRQSIELLAEAYSGVVVEQKYQRALWLKNEAETEEEFKDAVREFRELKGYKEADKLAEEATEAAEHAAKLERMRKLRNIASVVLASALVFGIVFGAIKFKSYLDNREREEQRRVEEEKARTIRQDAVKSFLEGEALAKVKLSRINSETPDVIFADMLSILAYEGDGNTYTKAQTGKILGRSTYFSEISALIEQYASEGNTNANIFLGDVNFTGLNGTRNLEKALEYYSRVFETGNTYALTAAAEVNERLKEYDTAIKLYDEAALNGDKSASNSSRRVKSTVNYLKNADSGDPEAQYQAGLVFKEGTNNADLERALSLLTKAAEHGHARAQFTLAGMYNQGEIVRRDYDQAITWYKKAASQGILEAETHLGDIYYNVKHDYKTAREYFVAPAKKGDPKAEYYIGLMFELGQTVSRNYGQAVEWYEKAAAQGYEDAVAALVRVRKEQTKAQRSIRGTKVNLRSLPNINANSIARLDEGTPVEVLKEEYTGRDKWCNVKLQSGTTGWIRGDYVQSRLGTRGPHGGEYRSINADDVNLRGGPGRSYNSIKKMNDGNLVEVIEQRRQGRETWCRVFTLDEQQGWVLKTYVRNRRSF